MLRQPAGWPDDCEDGAVSGDPQPWITDLDQPYDADLDVVTSQPRPFTPRQRRVAALAVVIVVVVAAGAWYADGRRRAHEFDRLLSCTSTAEAARSAAELRIGAMASYVRPSLAVLGAPNRGLYLLIAREAEVVRPDFAAALRGCEAVSVLGIHGALEGARSQYVSYLRAEGARLSAVASDGSHAYDDTDNLAGLRSRAFEALAAAAPDDSARRRVLAVARVER
jgi:hypothetical protein